MIKIKSGVCIAIAFFLLAVNGYTESRSFSLLDAENSAIDSSPRLKSLASEQNAADARASGQKTRLYPKLTLDGSYKYITTVPEVSMPLPGASPIKLGDNNNYSVGPSLNWTVLDFGATKNAYKSAGAAAEVKRYETEAARKQIIFAARTAYFNVVLDIEQLTLYTEALKLANAQYEDIKVNVLSGTKSLSDELKSHQEVILRMKQLRQVKADLSSALKDLSEITGIDSSSAEFDGIDSMLARFESLSSAKMDEKHPVLMAYAKSAEAAEYSKLAAGSLRWPKLQISARSSLDYPNGPTLESFNQNTLGAAFSMPLFEFGASKNRINESENARQAVIQRREQAFAEMKRDWDKTSAQISNLEDQRKLNDISVAETGQLAQIVFGANKAGSVSYIEVENANFKALEAKMQSLKIKVQLLMNRAVLAGMSE